MAACGQAIGQFWAPLTTAVQMGHQQTAGAVKGGIGKGQVLLVRWGGGAA